MQKKREARDYLAKLSPSCYKEKKLRSRGIKQVFQSLTTPEVTVVLEPRSADPESVSHYNRSPLSTLSIYFSKG